MDRRMFITMISAGALTAPLAAEAQVGKLPRIGWLMGGISRLPRRLS